MYRATLAKFRILTPPGITPHHSASLRITQHLDRSGLPWQAGSMAKSTEPTTTTTTKRPGPASGRRIRRIQLDEARSASVLGEYLALSDAEVAAAPTASADPSNPSDREIAVSLRRGYAASSFHLAPRFDALVHRHCAEQDRDACARRIQATMPVGEVLSLVGAAGLGKTTVAAFHAFQWARNHGAAILVTNNEGCQLLGESRLHSLQRIVVGTSSTSASIISAIKQMVDVARWHDPQRQVAVFFDCPDGGERTDAQLRRLIKDEQLVCLVVTQAKRTQGERPIPQPIPWAASLAIQRVEDAYERATGSYSGQQRLSVVGREGLEEAVPRSLGCADYPTGTDDDWRALADLAYEAALESWRAGGNTENMMSRASQVA